MNWQEFDGGTSIGQRGSEDGIILRDEELDHGARITMERGGRTAPFAITCGIYGWMVHTRFFGTDSEAQAEFESMKPELGRILDTIPLASEADLESKVPEVAEALSGFVERFP